MKKTKYVILISLLFFVIITTSLLLFIKEYKPMPITYPSVRHFNALPNPQHEVINRSLDDFWRVYLKGN